MLACIIAQGREENVCGENFVKGDAARREASARRVLAISFRDCYNTANHSEEEKEYLHRSESGTVRAGRRGEGVSELSPYIA